MRNVKFLALALLLLSFTASAYVIKESEEDTDIKFCVNKSGTVSCDDNAIDGATGRLKTKEITDNLGTGAPNFPFGATGITATIGDFNLSAISGSDATVNAGSIQVSDGKTLKTWNGTGTTSGDFGNLIITNKQMSGKWKTYIRQFYFLSSEQLSLVG